MLQVLVASHRILASPPQEVWPPWTCVTRPINGFTKVTADTFAVGGFEYNQLLGCTAPVATRSTSNYHGQFLSINKISQAYLAHLRRWEHREYLRSKTLRPPCSAFPRLSALTTSLNLQAPGPCRSPATLWCRRDSGDAIGLAKQKTAKHKPEKIPVSG